MIGAICQDGAQPRGIQAACKAYRRPFANAIDGRGVSRPAAYALKDKGLSLILPGLTRDGVPVEF